MNLRKTISNRLLSCYYNDIEKSKYKKPIVVRGKYGNYVQVREVGSEDKLTKHHGLDSIMPSKEGQKRYEDQLLRLYEKDGKFYDVRQLKRQSSYGRSKGFPTSTITGAIQVELLPIEKKYKKELHKQNEISEPNNEKLNNAIKEAEYEGYVKPEKSLAYKNIKNRSKLESEEIHKRTEESNVGKKLREKEKEEHHKKMIESEEESNKNKEELFDKKMALANNLFANFDFKNSSVKDLRRKILFEIGAIPTKGQDLNVLVTTDSGQKIKKSWKKLKNWLGEAYGIKHLDDSKLPFTNLEFVDVNNPWK